MMKVLLVRSETTGAVPLARTFATARPSVPMGDELADSGLPVWRTNAASGAVAVASVTKNALSAINAATGDDTAWTSLEVCQVNEAGDAVATASPLAIARLSAARGVVTAPSTLPVCRANAATGAVTALSILRKMRETVYRATTTRNGNPISISGQQEDGRFVVRTQQREFAVPADIHPVHPWSLRFVRAATLISPESGRTFQHPFWTRAIN